MKISVLILWLFFAFPALAEEDYSSSFIYSAVLEPLLGLDKALNKEQFKVTHCRVLDEEESIIYQGLGSCFYHELPLFSEETEDSKKVLVHVAVGSNVHDLLISWNPFSVEDLLEAYGKEELIKLSIDIQAHSEDYLNSFLESALLVNPQPALKEMFSVNIHKIQLSILPQENSDSEIKISLWNRAEQFIDSYSIMTNYYIGAEEFFIASKDIYASQNNKQ